MKKFLLFLALGSTSFTSWAIKETMTKINDICALYDKVKKVYRFSEEFILQMEKLKELFIWLERRELDIWDKIWEAGPNNTLGKVIDRESRFHIPSNIFESVINYVKNPYPDPKKSAQAEFELKKLLAMVGRSMTVTYTGNINDILWIIKKNPNLPIPTAIETDLDELSSTLRPDHIQPFVWAIS